MGKCKGKFQTAFEFYTPEIFMVGDNFGAVAKFFGTNRHLSARILQLRVLGQTLSLITFDAFSIA